MWDGLIIGALFGFALHRGGLTRYSRIIGTLLMKDFKAMKFMFAGLAITTLIYGMGDLLELGPAQRINGYFGMGHIIGGILFGAGMGLAGL
ncbi:MAG: YeeE/YedE family protein [Nitrospirae bacterium]|nr:YeeE/YedE family protein [Nitrospirota bacterium]